MLGIAQTTGADRVRRTATAVHLFSLVLALAVLLYAGRQLWFFYDELAVVGNPSLPLLAPSNEHWSTLPYLVYGSLYPVFGLRTYLPYLAVVQLLHVGTAHLLWRSMISSRVSPLLATALAVLFLFFGAGSQNLTWAFQMGFVGSVFFGLVEVALVDHDGPFGPRDAAAWIAAAAALMCSGIGLPMVFMAGMVALLRRGPAALLKTVIPPAAFFAAWYLAYGHQAATVGLPDIGQMGAFVYRGLSATLGQATGLDRLGLSGLPLAALLVFALVTGRRLRREAPQALAGLAAAFAFFSLVSVGRLAFGVDYAQSSRYLYIAAALLLPVTAVALGWLTRRDPRLEILVVALVLLSAINGLALLQNRFGQQLVADALTERHALAAADFLATGPPIVSSAPDPQLAPQLHVDQLNLYRLSKALPDERGLALPTALDRETVKVQLQLALGRRPRFELPVPGLLGTLAGADATRAGAGCWRLTSRSASPELRFRAARPFSLGLFALADSDLRLAAAPGGEQVQADVASVHLRRGERAYLDSVMDSAVVTIGLPIGNPLEVCGISFGQ